jgi:quinoprotein glucose dehydrogenase
MQTQVPGNYTAPTQPYPTWPAPVDPIIISGITDDFLIDYTPELRAQAREIIRQYNVGGLYVPPLPVNHGNGYLNNVGCMGGGNVIPHPPAADPSTGLMFVSHSRSCSAPGFMAPTNGVDEDDANYPVPGQGGATPNSTPTTGTTVAAWLPGGGGGAALPRIEGLPIYKQMNNQLTAYQMNGGEQTWSTAVGPTPEYMTTHPMLRGLDLPELGGNGWSIQMVTGDLLVQAQALSQGGAQYEPDAPLELHARDKYTGEILASVPLPAPAQYGMMTYMHDGQQYIVVQIGSVQTDFPGGLVAYRLR